MMHVGDIIGTSGDVQYIRDAHERYNEYIGGCSVHWGFQYKLKGFITLLPHMHHNISQCTKHPLMYSWYPQMYVWYPLMYL